MSYRQNEGIDTFLVIESEMIYTDSYELAMLRNNDIKGIIRPDIVFYGSSPLNHPQVVHIPQFHSFPYTSPFLAPVVRVLFTPSHIHP